MVMRFAYERRQRQRMVMAGMGMGLQCRRPSAPLMVMMSGVQ